MPRRARPGGERRVAAARRESPRPGKISDTSPPRLVLTAAADFRERGVGRQICSRHACVRAPLPPHAFPEVAPDGCGGEAPISRAIVRELCLSAFGRILCLPRLGKIPDNPLPRISGNAGGESVGNHRHLVVQIHLLTHMLIVSCLPFLQNPPLEREGGEVAGSRGGLPQIVTRTASGHLAAGFLAYPDRSQGYVLAPGSTASIWRASDRHRVRCPGLTLRPATERAASDRHRWRPLCTLSRGVVSHGASGR